MPFSPSKEQWSPVPRPRRSAELHLSLSQRACVLFLSRLFLSSSSSAGSLYKVYRRVNFFDIAPPCCSRNKRKQFVPDHKYFASRETFFCKAAPAKDCVTFFYFYFFWTKKSRTFISCFIFAGVRSPRISHDRLAFSCLIFYYVLIQRRIKKSGGARVGRGGGGGWRCSDGVPTQLS